MIKPSASSELNDRMVIFLLSVNVDQFSIRDVSLFRKRVRRWRTRLGESRRGFRKIASSEKLFAPVWIVASDVPEGNVTQLSALLWRLTQELFPDTGQSSTVGVMTRWGDNASQGEAYRSLSDQRCATLE